MSSRTVTSPTTFPSPPSPSPRLPLPPHYLQPLPPHHWPKLVCLDVLIGVPTLFHTFQPNIGTLGPFVWPKGYFSLFWPLFVPRRVTFGTFWVWQMGQTVQPGCPECRCNLFPTCSTIYGVTYGHNCENANFCPFFGHVGLFEALLKA